MGGETYENMSEGIAAVLRIMYTSSDKIREEITCLRKKAFIKG